MKVASFTSTVTETVSPLASYVSGNKYDQDSGSIVLPVTKSKLTDDSNVGATLGCSTYGAGEMISVIVCTTYASPSSKVTSMS